MLVGISCELIERYTTEDDRAQEAPWPAARLENMSRMAATRKGRPAPTRGQKGDRR